MKVPRDDVAMWRDHVDVVPDFPKFPVLVDVIPNLQGSVTDIDAVPIPIPVPVQTCIPLPTEVSGTRIDVVPNLPKCPVPVLMSYRTYLSIRCLY